MIFKVRSLGNFSYGVVRGTNKLSKIHAFWRDDRPLYRRMGHCEVFESMWSSHLCEFVSRRCVAFKRL